MIKIKNVTKTYNNNITAIKNLSLDIPDGKIIGFIGLNGAGKTTLIKMMTGILKPDKGTITINDLDIIKDALEAKQNIGYITDSPDMFLKLTFLLSYHNYVLSADIEFGVYKTCMYESASVVFFLNFILFLNFT